MLARSFALSLLGSSSVLSLLAFASPGCAAAQPQWREAELLAILASDAADADKALTCKRLAVCGSADATAALGKLLDSPQLSSWARIALEAIPDSSADNQLISALDRVTGTELLGVINSLGVRHSSSACEPLAKLVVGADPKVATAAILALGKIGHSKSEPVLVAALNADRLECRNAAAEACVRLAEAHTQRERTSAAVRVCRAVRASQAESNWQAAAARAEIVADREHRLERLVELLQADDAVLFEMGLVTAREIVDASVTAALTELLPKLAADEQTQILHVLRDRADQQALPAVSKLVQSASPQVQVAALEALGTLGNATCLTQLVKLHESTADPTVRSAAWEALCGLPGAEVNSALEELAQAAKGQRLGSLIELVGERQMSAVPLLQSATRSEDQAIRAAAWLALGRTVEPKDLQLLIEALLAPAHAKDRQSIVAGLRKAAVRMPDSTITVRELANAIPVSPAPTKTDLIQIIADVEGPEALAVVSAAARDDEPALKETASAALGKWRSLDAAPMLLEIAKTEAVNKYRVRALRGYIRIARQFDMTAADRVRMCEQALDAADRDEERALVLDVLRPHPSLELLNLIDGSSHREHLRQATPAIIGVLLQDYPELNTELLEKLKAFGYEPNALPEI